MVKNPPVMQETGCDAGDLGLIPGLGRSPGEGNGNPLQYSCLENPMDRGAWWATVHRVARTGSLSLLQGIFRTQDSPALQEDSLPAELLTISPHTFHWHCLLASWVLPLPGASEVEGGHTGMGGGDSRVWTPPRVAGGQGNPACRCLLGSRLGAQARAEDAWVLRPGWGWGHGWRTVASVCPPPPRGGLWG